MIVGIACLVMMLGLGACGDEPLALEEGIVPAESPHKVNFSIGVAVADAGLQEDVPSGDVYPEAPVNDKERMHTLRIIIVRPDNTVEANRAFTLSAPAVFREYEEIEVEGGEPKRVYLFANEATLREDRSGALLNYSLGTLYEGTRFPQTELENLRIALGADEQMDGPLPMSECHEVYVPDTDIRRLLFVTRAAVKFTFHITNSSARALTVTGLTLDKMADREYFLPRNAVYEDRVSEWGEPFKEIITFDTPAETVYRTFDIYGKVGLDRPLLSARGGTLDIASVYQNEGKYMDPLSDGRNYGLSLDVDFGGLPMRFSSYLPNLSRLPRNTHAKVNITIHDTDVSWQVDVIPYSSVPLEPEFGL
ncbi:MAG: hypothetical protein NC388_10770 [Clostridium sp.]|nr:hypothetical protein [Clostridium sp.]